MQHRRQGEIQRPQTKNREDVRGVDDVGISGDREHRRHRIHGEDQIGNLDQDQRQKQRRHPAHHLASLRIGLMHKEIMAVQLVRHAEAFAHEPKHGVRVQVHFLVIGHQHLDAGENQEGGKDVQNPAVLRHQRGTQTDHDAAQHDHAKDAPEQHPVLIQARNGKIAEDQRDDKDVVQSKRLFHDESRHVFCRRLGTELIPHKTAKADAQRDVQRGKPQAFGHADFMIVLVQHPKVEHQQGQHDADKGEPKPERRSKEQREKQGIHERPLVAEEPAWDRPGALPGRHRAHSMRSDITTSCRQRGPARCVHLGVIWPAGKGGGKKFRRSYLVSSLRRAFSPAR